MRYQKIDNKLFVQNRANFAKKMKSNSIAIFCSNPIMPKSADASYKWRQNPDLFYLSGIDQEETFLILFPDAVKNEWKEILFVRETNEHIAIWEGEKLNKEQAQDVSGITNVLWSSGFDGLLSALVLQADTIYLNMNENDRAGESPLNGELQFANNIIKRFPLHKIERAAPFLHELRSVKSKIELDLIGQAIQITNDAFHRVLKFVKPNVWEYEVEAEITHEFLKKRATGHAYEPISASGANACVLHYVSNNKACKKDDLLLLDFGAEYANYCADLSRTIPISGRFSKRQKEVYNAVLHVHNEAKKLMKEGMILNDFNLEVGNIMQDQLIKLKLIDKIDVKKQNTKAPLYKKYFPHGTAHFLGIDVHDVGNRYKKLKAGAVLTCEPGIYIREEGIGVRIENNIVVTKSKPLDLMSAIPIEADHIETLMNTKSK
jgi:Xaa-Pro aminopeptidase